MIQWMFLDMNSFFASCEQHDDPRLRGCPVGVCPVLTESGAVIAASIEAKRRGVGMGVRVTEARRRCRDILLLQARPSRYIELHHAIAASITKHLPITKTYSIDEWAIHLQESERQPERAVALARRIKAQVYSDLSPALRCSIGLASTRLLAKTACELRKPDGLTCLTDDLMPGAIIKLPITDIPGIGAGIGTRLRKAGVLEVGDLWKLSRVRCRRVWGSVQGEHFWYGLHGIDTPEPTTHRSSMGHAHVLPPAYRSEAGAYAIMIRLLCKLGTRLRFHGYFARHLHASMKFHEPLEWARDVGLPCVQDTPTLLEHFERLWTQRLPLDAARRVPGFDVAGPRQVSVTVSGLIGSRQATGHLFARSDRPLRLSQTMDHINHRFGGQAIHPASMHLVAKYVMEDKIAFGRVPDEILPM